jgi:hypothetical protein
MRGFEMNKWFRNRKVVVFFVLLLVASILSIPMSVHARPVEMTPKEWGEVLSTKTKTVKVYIFEEPAPPVEVEVEAPDDALVEEMFVREASELSGEGCELLQFTEFDADEFYFTSQECLEYGLSAVPKPEGWSRYYKLNSRNEYVIFSAPAGQDGKMGFKEDLE